MPTPIIPTEVRWTSKSGKTATHERIVEIGVPTMDGQCNRIPHGEAVRLQLAEVKLFGVSINGQMVGLTVAKTPDCHRYLKSFDDGDQPESLLRLPDCP